MVGTGAGPKSERGWWPAMLVGIAAVVLQLAACAPGAGGGDREAALLEAARQRAGSLGSVQFYVTNQLENTVSIVDIEVWAEVHELAVGQNPSDITIAHNLRTAYVANQGDGTVSFIDTRELEVVATVAVGPRPHAMVLAPDDRLLFVPTLDDNQVVVVDTNEAEVIARIELAAEARTTVARYDPDHRYVYVLSRGSDDLSVIDPQSLELVRSFSVGAGSEPQRFVFSNDGATVFVTQKKHGQIVAFDPATGEQQGEPITVGAGPTGLALSPTGSLLVAANTDANSVTVIDAITRDVLATVDGIAIPQQIAFNRQGTRFYVASAGANQLVVVETTEFRLEDTIAVGARPHDIAIKAPATGGTCG